MAIKAPTGSLYAESPEDQALADEIKSTYAKLRQSLDARQSPMFDPVLLAMAQGFLSPTKTGSFGEVLGNVAAQVGPAQQAEEKRAQETAMMKMELAQKELAQRQATRGEQEYQNILKGLPGMGSTGAPAAGQAVAPIGALEGAAGASTGVPAQPPKVAQKPLSPEDVLRLRGRPGFEEKGKALQDYLEFGRKGVISTPQGMFDVDKREYLTNEIPGQKQEEFSTPYGKFAMRPSDYEQFMKAEKAGQGREWMKRYTEPATGPDGGRKTVFQSKGEEKEQEITIEQRAKDDAKRYEDFVKRGSMAGPQLARLTSLQQLVNRPEARQYLGVFEGPKVQDAMLKLFESSGKGLPQVNEIRDMFINLGLDKDVKADQLLAMQQIALVNLEVRKISRAPGEGAQSDLENKLALAAGLDRSDSPAALPKKIEFLKTQAEFERNLARELDKSKLSATKFVLSPEYDRLLNDYQNKLSRVLGVSPQAVASPSSKPVAGDYTAAGKKLREKLERKP